MSAIAFDPSIAAHFLHPRYLASAGKRSDVVNPATLAELALVAPQWPRGYLCEGWRRGRRPLLPWARRAALRDFLSETNAPSDFIACEIGALASFGRPAADELGAPLIGWTVRTRSQLERAERLADALIFEHLEPGLVRPSQLALA